MSHWFENGDPTERIAVDDRAVQYGDGVFETIAVRDGEPRLWNYHMLRLAHACERVGLGMPAENLLSRDVERAVARSTVNSNLCTAKIILTAGAGPRGYRRMTPVKSTTLVGVYDYTPVPRYAYVNGVDTILCETPVSIQPKLAGFKTLNRLDQVLARAEWSDDSVFEGLMCDADGLLICGTMSNVFIVRNNAISTPILNRGGVAGVMRRYVIELLRANDIECTETEVAIAELQQADEVFLSNSQFGVVPVKHCGVMNWAVGEATQSVMALLAYNGVPECEL